MFAKKALAASLSAEPVFVESVFSTYLYTGNGSTQTITNGVDLAGEGGLVWIQSRSNSYGGYIYDTARGTNKRLQPLSTSGQFTVTQDVTAFNSNGFTMGSETGINGGSGQTYASWTFRKQAKFFDVVTYTGTGSNRTVAHNLGSVPGCIIVKRTDSGGTLWAVYHRSLGATQDIALNSTAAAGASTLWNSTGPTSTVFSLGTLSAVNASGGTYVAYLFAHNAGGFGLSGTDNVISCGSFTTNGVNGSFSVTTGYEPQWWLVKNTSRPGDWHLVDIMRGATASATGRELFPNLSSAETSNYFVTPTATGFYGTAYDFGGADTYIYIAIRRGPMKVPTSGTSVFSPTATRSSGSNQATPLFNAGWPVDLLMQGFKSGNVNAQMVIPRLTNNILRTSTTGAETNGAAAYDFGGMLGVLSVGGADNTNSTICGWNFRRAPGFFDVVCYTGTGVNPNVLNHNLGAVPEFIIIKNRSTAADWVAQYGNSIGGLLNSTAAVNGAGVYAGSTVLTSTQISINTAGSALANASGDTFVMYLFATVAGVSKVGSYTGNGSSQTINCGFTGGARFVLIKRTDSTGNWLVADSARGIVAGNDPLLYLNSTAAEITTLDWIDADSSGFIVNQESTANANVNAATYIYFSVA